MKKILLGLFLILGAISFAAPSRINTAKIQQDGNTVILDDSDAFAFGKLIDQSSVLAVTYYVGKVKLDMFINYMHQKKVYISM